MTAVFRYPGGKVKLAVRIANYVMEFNSNAYMEPFCGGAAVAIELAKRNSALHITLNDKNKKMSDFWKTLITDYDTLADEVFEYVPTVESFTNLKQKQSAFSTLVINRCSHSGRGGGPIGGTTQSGNWKIGARWNNTKLANEIRTIGKLLRGRCDVLCCDGIELIENVDNDISIYADPPYVKAGEVLYDVFFSTSDHIRLSEVIKTKNNWVLSYDNNQFVKTLYDDIAGVLKVELDIVSAIHSGGGKKQTEVLYILKGN
jgi:DNA adenine methylase